MKLWVYYIIAWVSGILTLVFSFGGAAVFIQHMGQVQLEDGGVVQGHMGIMEFVIPLVLIGIVCFILYLCVSLFCILRKMRTTEHRFIHFLLSFILYLLTTIGTLPLVGFLLN